MEVQETHLGIPGPGTVRRWRREAPEGFQFSLLGSKEIGAEGFRDGEVVQAALKALAGIAKQLNSVTAVFVAPPDFACSPENKKEVKGFLQLANKTFENVVFDAGSLWEPDEVEALSSSDRIMVVRDPLNQGISKRKRAYYRMPGPAGHKSRYEDPAIDRLAEIASGADHEEVTYVFTNVDMFADAKRFRKAMKL